MDAKLGKARADQTFWEQLALEADHAKAALAAQLATLQAQSATQAKERVAGFVTAANAAAAKLLLDETETRKLIDEQLCQAGWTVDSTSLRHARGARPEKGKNLAIAEWPTASGPADYVLFVGLKPMATVEAKRRNIDVSAALQQAKRYSRDFTASDATSTQADVANSESLYRLPFAFSTNGRPYLRQLATKSGVWFCDLRWPDNLGRALDGWYTPAGLTALLKRDEKRADTQLQSEPFAYWWLAFDWHNLRICGNAGNRKKGTYFPLRAGCPRCAAHGDLRHEDPQLLDPVDPDDPALISFNLEGRAIPAPHVTEGWEKSRVEYSVQRYNLDFPPLMDKRKAVWANCWEQIQHYLMELRLYHADGTNGIARDRYKQALRALREMLCDDKELSAVARACVLSSGDSRVIGILQTT